MKFSFLITFYLTSAVVLIFSLIGLPFKYLKFRFFVLLFTRSMTSVLRLFKIRLDKNEKKISKIIKEKFYTKRNDDLAEALMEFGALVCKPINPLCTKCNLKNYCYYSTTYF